MTERTCKTCTHSRRNHPQGYGCESCECRVFKLAKAVPIKRPTENDMQQAKAMLEDGKSYHAVGLALDRSVNTIRKWHPGYGGRNMLTARALLTEANERATKRHDAWAVIKEEMDREHGNRIRECSFEGCDRDRRTRGLCNAHYVQEYRGNELAPIRRRL